MQKISFKRVFQYLYDQLTGNFIGFLIGSSATGLVSQFFETRGIRNLWGLTAKKAVIDKETFQNLEWIISIVIGFIVFEIFTKVIKAQLAKHFPRWKQACYRWVIREHIRENLQAAGALAKEKSSAWFTAARHGMKQVLNRSINHQ